MFGRVVTRGMSVASEPCIMNNFETITADQLAPVTGGFQQGIVAPAPGTLERMFESCMAGKKNMASGRPLYGAALQSHCTKYVNGIRF